jgi:DNA-directed RNA polymerase subunit M/transcription elongation factor TFIIS
MQVHRPRRSAQLATTCRECGAAEAIQIDLTLPDGTEVRFSSCHRCEHRWWSSDGEVIDLTTVLDKSRKR